MNTDTVRQAVDEGNRKFGAAAADKDYAGIAALYTETAKLLPPDAPIVTGKKAIEEFLALGRECTRVDQYHAQDDRP